MVQCNKILLTSLRDRSRIWIRDWIHKRHTITRPDGRAMVCLLQQFWRKLTMFYYTVLVLEMTKDKSLSSHRQRPVDWYLQEIDFNDGTWLYNFDARELYTFAWYHHQIMLWNSIFIPLLSDEKLSPVLLTKSNGDFKIVSVHPSFHPSFLPCCRCCNATTTQVIWIHLGPLMCSSKVICLSDASGQSHQTPKFLQTL